MVADMEASKDQKEKARKLMTRYESLKEKRTPWEPLWQDAATYIRPRREFLFNESSKGKRTGAQRFSSHAIKANQIHADGLQGNLISPATQWFKLNFRQKDFANVPYAKDWLERCEEELYGVFRSSNYYAAMNEYLLDGGSICTACLYTDYDYKDDAIIFQTINPAEIVIGENSRGLVDTVYREFTMTAGQMAEKFKDLPEDIKRKVDRYELDEERTIVHCVTRRYGIDENRKSNKNMDYGSYYIDQESGDIIHESGYEEFPYMVLRWRKISGELYGRGPGLDAIEEILRLNQFSKGQLQLAQLLVEPPLNIPEAMKGKIRYAPRARNYLPRDAKIESLTVPGDYQIGEHAMDKIEAVIDSFFNVDFFMMMQKAERQMTAREVIERQGEKATVIGSAVGRLNQETLTPLIKRVFGLLYRHGKIPPPPEEILQMGARIDIELVGPLAMAQKHYAKSQGINKGIEAIGPLAQYDPTVLDWVNFDVLVKDSAESAGMPQKAIREDHEVEELRIHRAQQQAQQQQMAQLGQMADMVPKMNKKIERGSPLEDINEQLAASMGANPQGAA